MTGWQLRWHTLMSKCPTYRDFRLRSLMRTGGLRHVRCLLLYTFWYIDIIYIYTYILNYTLFATLLEILGISGYHSYSLIMIPRSHARWVVYRGEQKISSPSRLTDRTGVNTPCWSNWKVPNLDPDVHTKYVGCRRIKAPLRLPSTSSLHIDVAIQILKHHHLIHLKLKS